MTVSDFLDHYRLTENPFRGEEARSDAVFSRMARHASDASPLSPQGDPSHSIQQPTLHHSDFEKILGDLRRPNSSVVFGEKGSGKTAIRLQLAQRIAAFNAQNPAARVWLIAYDDLNGVLDRLHERLGGKSPLESLQKTRLVDHMDALLHAVVPRLVDALLLPESATAQELNLGPNEKKPVKRLDRPSRADVLILQSIYDRPDHAAVRTLQLRRKLRISPPTDIVVGTIALTAIPMLLVAAAIWLKFFPPVELMARLTAATPAWLPAKFDDAVLVVIGALYIALAFKLLVWDRLALRRTARRVRRQVRVVSRRDTSYSRSLRQIKRAIRDNADLPVTDSDETRYTMLERLRGVLRTFGYSSLIVIVDRVDEPTLVRGDPDRMKAVIWPLLNNKFLQQEGVGIKMLLPMELRHAVFRESSTFFQEARLDKQSFIEHLSWTGATLYDLCESRITACSLTSKGSWAQDSLPPVTTGTANSNAVVVSPPELSSVPNALDVGIPPSRTPSRDQGGPPQLIELFAEDVTRQDLIDALDRVHQPRDAFKLLYRCLAEHCATVTRGQQEFKIPRHILLQVAKQETERVQQVFRGIRPG
jgi:hypothetical protein